MSSRKGFMFYASYIEAVDKFRKEGAVTDADELCWYRAIIRFALYGESPMLNGVLGPLWALVRPTLLRSRSRALAATKDDVHDDVHGDVHGDVHPPKERNGMDRGFKKIENINILSSSSADEARPPHDYNRMMKVWNEHCGALPMVKSLSVERKRKLAMRITEWGGTDDAAAEKIASLLHAANASDFLSGRLKRWKASFDWLIANGENWRKIEEGNYDAGFGRGYDTGVIKTDNDPHKFDKEEEAWK